jgi:2-polyprenyl-3-methyl-5-hydroxy-6-metoxy-1,4-benzoquinol methylase
MLPGNGQPQFLGDDGGVDPGVSAKTQESFGFEWTTFHGVRPEWQDNFSWYMAPLTKEFFRGKVVLDAGCGMGRHLYYAARSGAQVIGVDFSRAVEVAHQNIKHLETATVVQADLLQLPFRAGTFDFVYCLGVLHHLSQPLMGLRLLVSLVRNRGECRIYVYHQIDRSPKWKYMLFRLASIVRRVTTRLPHSVLLVACWPLSAAIWLGCVAPYKLMRVWMPNSVWTKSWLFRQYAPYSFMVLVNDQFDRFSAPIERRYARKEVEDLMGRAGLSSIVVRSDFGWIGHGLKHDEVSVALPVDSKEAPRVS